MSKEQWFERFEQLEAEHPEISDEDIANQARHSLRADRADLIDRLKTERKENPDVV